MQIVAGATYDGDRDFDRELSALGWRPDPAAWRSPRRVRAKISWHNAPMPAPVLEKPAEAALKGSLMLSGAAWTMAIGLTVAASQDAQAECFGLAVGTAGNDYCSVFNFTDQTTGFDALGGTDTLDLDGSTNFTFDVSRIGAGYDSFEITRKSDSANITLIGAPAVATPWDIYSGTLTLSGGNAIADTSTVTLYNDATLALAANETIGLLSGVTNAPPSTIALSTFDLTSNATSSSGTSIASSTTGSGRMIFGGTANYNVVVTGAWAHTGDTVVGSNVNLTFGTATPAGSFSGSLAGNIVVSGNVNFGRANAYTYSGGISGTGNVQKYGAGTLTLNGSNTYSGFTYINYGTLAVSGGSAIGDLSPVAVSSSTTFDVQASETIGSLEGFGFTALNGSGVVLTTGGNNNSTTYSGLISGAGGLTKTGTGRLTLTGANLFSGAVSIFGGTLSISNASGLGAAGKTITIDGGELEAQVTLSSSGPMTIGAGNASLRALSGTTLTQSGNISGAGGLSTTGSGSVVLSGSNSYAGGTGVSGTLSVLGGAAIPDGSAVSIGASAIFDVQASETVGSIAGGTSRQIALSSGATLTTGGDNSSTFFSGTISGAGALAKVGTGTLTLNGPNTFTGGITAAAGTLRLQSNQAAGTGALTATGAVIEYRDGLSIATPMVLNTGTTQLLVSSLISATQSGVVSQTGGTRALEKTGAGVLTLSGANTFTGLTTVSAGTLAVTGSLAGAVSVQSGATLAGTGSIAGAVTVQNGGVLAPGASPGTLVVGDLILNPTSVVNFDLGQPGVVGGANNDLVTVTNNLTLDGTLNVVNSLAFGDGVYRLFTYGGTLTNNGLTLGTLPGPYTPATAIIQTSIVNQVNLVASSSGFVQFWDGGDTVADGTIDGGAGTWTAAGTNWTNATGSANDSWFGSTGIFGGAAGGAVTVSGTQAFGTLQFATNGYTLSGGALTTTGSTLRVDSGISAFLSTAIGGTGGLTKVDAGTLNLFGTNTFTGGLTISGGTVIVGADAHLGADAVTLNGGTLRAAGGLTNITRNITLTAAGGTLGNEIGSISTPTYSGVISGPGGLTVTSDVSVRLSGANTYAGSTTLAAGQLFLTGGGAIPDASAVTMASGSTLNVQASESIGSLAGAGTVSIDAGQQLTAGGNGASTTFSGAINGFVFGKAGGGTMTLTGAAGTVATYMVSGGTLTASGGNAIGDSAVVNVGSGATFALANSETIGNLAGVAGSSVNLGAHTLSAGSAFGIVFDGAISGTGGLTKVGAGSLFLIGTNTYTGATTVSAGQLTLDNGTALADSGAVVVNGGTLALFVGETIGSLAGSGGTVRADNVSGATLTAGGNNATTSYAGTLADGTGALSLVKTGTGALTLSGSNTHTGLTTVQQGALSVTGSLAGGVSVQSGAILAGTGSVSGNVTVQNGGILAAGLSPGTLTMGSLTLNATSQLNFELGQPNVVNGPNNDLYAVTGAVTLDGVLNVSNWSSFGDGVYRLMTYGGSLTDNGLSIGTMPGGYSGANSFIQTSVAGQVNLIAAASGLVQFWDGTNAANNSVIGGGAGTWNASNGNWTDAAGNLNAGWTGYTGVFSGAAGGGVTVSGTQNFGTLQFLTNGYVLSGGGLTSTGAIFRVDPGVTAAINTAIAGTGGLTKNDGGVLTLGGANTYAGATTINAGALSVSGGAAIPDASAVTVAASATLSVNASETIGSLAGAGAVSINGGTRLTAGGDGSSTLYSGLMGGEGGSEYAKAGAAATTLSGTLTSVDLLAQAGTLILSGASNRGANISSGATFQLGSGGATGALTANSSVTNNGTFVFNRSDAYTYSGVMSGTGLLRQAGTGTTILTGANTYTGGTQVNAGVLRVNGTILGPVTVASGGRLEGTGTVGATTVSGTLAPGAGGIGTLAMAGNLTFNSGSFFAVDVAPASADRVNVTGNASLAGTAQLSFAPGAYTAGSYTLIASSGPLSGTFSAVNTVLGSPGPALNVALEYTANQAILRLTPTSLVTLLGGTLTDNQRAVAGALDPFLGGVVPAAFNTLVNLPVGQIPGALDQLTGEIATGFESASAAQSSGFFNLLNLGGLDGGPRGSAIADVVTPASGGGAISFWAGVWGAMAENDGAPATGSADRDSDGTGFGTGMEFDFGDGVTAGFGLGSSHSAFDLTDRRSTGDSDLVQGALYARADLNGAHVGAALSYGRQDASTQRNVTGIGPAASYAASFGADLIGLRAELEIDNPEAEQTQINPFAAVEVQHLATDGYAERALPGSDPAFALTVAGQDTTRVTSELGLRLSSALTDGLDLTGEIAWEHRQGAEDAARAFFTAIPGAAFAVQGAETAEDAAKLGLGLSADLGGGVEATLKTDGTLADEESSVSGSFVLRMAF